MAGSISSSDPRPKLGYTGNFLAVRHPHVYFGVAAAEVVFFTVLGVVLMPRSVAGGVLVIVCGLLAAVLAALPAWWSERHPEQAEALSGRRRELSQQRARRHPLFFVVILPIVIGGDAALRWHTGSRGDAAHHGVWSWVIPAAAGLIIGGVAGTVLVVRARRAKPTS